MEACFWSWLFVTIRGFHYHMSWGGSWRVLVTATANTAPIARIHIGRKLSRRSAPTWILEPLQEGVSAITKSPVNVIHATDLFSRTFNEQAPTPTAIGMHGNMHASKQAVCHNHRAIYLFRIPNLCCCNALNTSGARITYFGKNTHSGLSWALSY